MTRDAERRLRKAPQRVARETDGQKDHEHSAEWLVQDLAERAALIHLFALPIGDAKREQSHNDVDAPASAQTPTGECLGVLAVCCLLGRAHGLVRGGILLCVETDGRLLESWGAPQDIAE